MQLHQICCIRAEAQHGCIHFNHSETMWPVTYSVHHLETFLKTAVGCIFNKRDSVMLIQRYDKSL